MARIKNEFLLQGKLPVLKLPTTKSADQQLDDGQKHDFWLCCLTYYHVGHFMQLSIASTPEGRSKCVTFGPRFSSTEILAALHATNQKKRRIPLLVSEMNPKDLLLQSSKAWPALTYDIHVQKQSQKRAPAIQDDPHRIREKLRGDEQACMDAVEHEHLECSSASVDRETRLSHQSLEDPDFESMHKRLMVELYGETPTQESEDNDVADMLLDIHVARDISASSNYVAADTETPESKYLTIWRAEAVASVRALQNCIDSLQTIVDGTHTSWATMAT